MIPFSMSIEIEVNYLTDSFELIFTSYDTTAMLTIAKIAYNYFEYYQDTTVDYY